MPGIFPVTNTGGGKCMAFPDACWTPPSPSPIPYPNIADLADGSGSKKVKIKGKEVLRKGDSLSKSQGDDPGKAGFVSGTVKSKCELMTGWPKVKAEGAPVSHQVSVVGHNGPGGKNIPVGLVASVSITKVKVGVDLGLGSDIEAIIRCDDPPAPPPASDEDKKASQEWSEEKCKEGQKTPAEQADNARKVAEREQQVRDAQGRVLSEGGEMTPQGVTPDRLRATVEGVPGPGGPDRIPLTFPSADLWHQFQAELTATLQAGGISDAVVQAIGSGTTGWSGNPGKAMKPWSPKSDADFSVFSEDAMAQAHKANTAINPKYGIFKNGSAGKAGGFSDTPAGKKLKLLAIRWTQILYDDAFADGVEFKLNTTLTPLAESTGAITAVAMGG